MDLEGLSVENWHSTGKARGMGPVKWWKMGGRWAVVGVVWPRVRRCGAEGSAGAGEWEVKEIVLGTQGVGLAKAYLGIWVATEGTG